MLARSTTENGQAKRKIIDSHVHFWDLDRIYVPWVYKVGGRFKKSRLAKEYRQAVPDRLQVEGVVYVEVDAVPTQGLVEAKWIHEYAKGLQHISDFGGIAGLVVYAPVSDGKHVVKYLDLLKTIVDFNHVKGVRYLVEDVNRDPSIPASPTFVEGVQALEAYGLSFDININAHACPDQFPPVVELVRQCPNIQFVLDHMAKPPIGAKVGDKRFEWWKTHIYAIASYPNIVCKVSGAITEIDESQGLPSASQIQPFLHTVLDAFGHDRLLAGGDWPVVELKGGDIAAWFGILEDMTAKWSQENQDKLWFDNARRVYRL